ncbi:MAG: type II toxin-antitoxin system RelE/ParE family toxin [Oscillospiraceae bacterium]|nr:type II toxin-antitoxin system RelE/ParE family toxin [Oscillospiraceae bacterium]
MGYSIVYLPAAKQDIENIAEYLSQFYANTFKNFMITLEKAIFNLENMPYIGSEYKDYRRLVVEDYLVFYKVNDTNGIVKIYRVLRGAQGVEIEKV